MPPFCETFNQHRRVFLAITVKKRLFHPVQNPIIEKYKANRMKKTSHGMLLSAGDLSGYISCHHLSHLNLAVSDGRLDATDYRDPLLAILQERGLDFETGYLRQLEAEGRKVVRPDPGMDELSVERTKSEMAQGAEIIYQAALRSDGWHGRADFLIKVDKSSRLGDWSYEVVDAKLARETRAGTILQLCLYAELLADIQGVLPEYVHVITPEEDFTQHSYRSDDFMAYFRLKSKVLAIVAKNEVPIPTYPDPCAHCGICGWWAYCDKQRRCDDHLSLVAGLSGAQAGASAMGYSYFDYTSENATSSSFQTVPRRS